MGTVMQELLKEWEDRSAEEFEIYFANNYDKLLEKEKQQIIEAYNTPTEVSFRGGKARDGEQYYKETFTK